MTSTGSTKRPSAERVSADAALGALRRGLGDATSALVVGGYGCGNVGDEAILSVLVADLRSIGVAPSFVSADPGGTERLHDVRAVAARPRELLPALRAHDGLVVGGGGIFSAYMGRASKMIPVVALAAKAMRKRLVFRALGAYASTPRAVGRALAVAVQRSDLVSVRDDASVAALREFGVRRAILVEDDPALRLAPAPARITLGGRTVGITVRRLRDPQAQLAARATIVTTIDRLVDAGRAPVLLPFCAHPSAPLEQDDRYAAEVLALVAHPEACRVVNAALGPREMLGVVSQLDAVIAMRFHAIVFGYVAGTPVLALPYDDKCISFVAEHAIDSLPPGSASAHAVTAAVESLVAKRAAA